MFLSAGSSAGVNLLYTDVCTIGRSCTAIQVGHILHSMQASHFLGCSESAWSSLPVKIRSVTRLERAEVPFLWVALTSAKLLRTVNKEKLCSGLVMLTLADA